MSRFIGVVTYSIDAKGRVNIPSKMRKDIAKEANDSFIVTRGFEKCIYAYPLDEWKMKQESFEKLSEYDEQSRFFLRTLLRYSDEIKMDPQQRISLPKDLLDFASIDKKVTIAGVMNHLEFWEPEEYNKIMNSHEESYEKIAEKVMTGRF